MNHFKSMFIVGLTLGSTTALGGTITVAPKQNLRNSSGFFRCSLWNQGDGFPVDYAKATQRVSAPIASERAVCTFQNVPAGKYAISVLHDENDNKEMDTTERGAPKEGFAFSNDAFPKDRRTPPFEAAAFDYNGSDSTITLEIRYEPAE